MESLDAFKSSCPALPIPDTSMRSKSFRERGAWAEVADAQNVSNDAPHDQGMGLLLIERGVAAKRVLRWLIVFVVLGLVFALLPIIDRPGLPYYGVICVFFFGLALYRFINFYLNRDLRVRIFREGFTFSQKGHTQAVYWRDVEKVQEVSEKRASAVFYFNRQKIKVHTVDGKVVEINQALDDIERIARLIQAIAVDFLLPKAIEILGNDGICDFGAFQISRYGIAHGKKKALPWSEVRSLTVENVGTTLIRVRKSESMLLPWETEAGGAVSNLELFLFLSFWFIEAAKQLGTGSPILKHTPSPPSASGSDGDVYYAILITKREAAPGTQKNFFVGSVGFEKKLTVKMPAGIQSGTVFQYPDYGQPIARSDSAGILYVKVLVETGIPFQVRLEQAQMVTEAILLMLGIIWLPLFSLYTIITNAALGILAGGLGGVLMSTQQRITGVKGNLLETIMQEKKTKSFLESDCLCT